MRTRIYYIGSNCVEVRVYPDGSKEHPRLTADEKKELSLRIRVDKVLEKISTSDREFTTLLSIPDMAGIGFVPYWTDVFAKKKKPKEVKEDLLSLARYKGLNLV